jgi:hypothetical protein
MSKSNSINFRGPSGTTATGRNGAAVATLDSLMAQSNDKGVTNKQQRPPSKQTPVQRDEQLQPRNATRQDAPLQGSRGQARSSARDLRPTPNPQPQRVSTQPLARGTQSVNVTNISTSTATSTNNALKVMYSNSQGPNGIWKLNNTWFVQGNTGSKTSQGKTSPTSSTTIGVSTEVVGKFPTSGTATVTLKAGIAGELTGSPGVPVGVKVKLPVSARADFPQTKTSSVYAAVSAETTISNNSPLTTKVGAQVGLDSGSTDGNFKLNVNGGVDQTLGGSAEIYGGVKSTFKLNEATSAVTELRFSNKSTELRGGIEIRL